MKCKDIYDLALALLGEDVSGTLCTDYEGRAPYLIGAFCAINAENDANYRKYKDLPTQSLSFEVMSLDEDFPLSDAFCAAGGYYLASLLIFDSDVKRSDTLFARSAKEIKLITSSFPFESHSTLNVYKN